MEPEWQEVQLDDVADLKGGYAFKSEDYTDSGRFVLRTVNITEAGRIRRDGATFISEGRASEFARFELNPLDTLFVMVGATLGKTGLVTAKDLPALLNQNMWVIRADPNKINPLFLHYSFKETSKSQVGFASGSARSFVRRDDFRKLSLRIPPRGVQDFIAGFLGSIDDKITLLRETNATLEAIAQALFKSWFVDFDPVRAKAEGRDPEGVPPEVADLFPGEFEDSELGAIPKDWSWGTLESHSELNPKSWTNKEHPNSIYYVDLANTKDNRIMSISEYLFDDAPSRARRVLREGDTIVGTVRPGNRSFAFIQDPSPGLTGSTGFAVLRPIKNFAAEFIFLAATRRESIETLAHLADGGAYPSVRPELVQRLQVVSPGIPILEAFHANTSPLLRRVAANEREANSLTNIRDTLLPRLMSGKLRIPDLSEDSV